MYSKLLHYSDEQDGRAIFNWTNASRAERERFILDLVNKRLGYGHRFLSYKDYITWMRYVIGTKKAA